MLSTLLLSILPCPVPLPSGAVVGASLSAPSELRQDDVAARIAEVGEDVAKLHELAAAYKEADDRASSRKVYERILEIDADDAAAHKALRHHEYDGQWFTSYAALSKYRRDEAKRMKEEHGLVRHNDEWVPEVDLPYIRMGWEKLDDGKWVSPHKLAMAKQAEEYLAKGWQQRAEDSSWIDPADFDLWREGMYKVDDEWFNKQEANDYHSVVGQWWEYIGEHFICRSTLDVDWTSWARWHADKTWGDLVEIYGTEPDEKPIFGVFNTLTQYNTFAAGDPTAQRPAAESTGFSSLHYAHLSDLWVDVVNVGGDNPAVVYIGGGIAFWDVNDAAMKPWGPFAVRHAAALSFGENVDRAWSVVSQFMSQSGGGGGAPPSIWDGKKLPSWFHYGAASYVERYAEDQDAASNGGDPWSNRNWAIGQVTAGGEPHSLEQIFELPLDINDIDGSTRYLHETGLVMSFIVDGDCKPVTKAHAALKKAFAAGDDVAPAVEALEQAILANEQAFRDYAGLGPKPTAEASAEPAADAVEASAGE